MAIYLYTRIYIHTHIHISVFIPRSDRTSVMPATMGPLMGSSLRSRHSSTSDKRSRIDSLYTSKNDTVTYQGHRGRESEGGAGMYTHTSHTHLYIYIYRFTYISHIYTHSIYRYNMVLMCLS